MKIRFSNRSSYYEHTWGNETRGIDTISKRSTCRHDCQSTCRYSCTLAEGRERRGGGGFAEFAALSAADFWCECVMGQPGGGQSRRREQSMLAISCSLRAGEEGGRGEGGNSSYTRDNCYWQIVMPVISHGGDRMDARSSPRTFPRFHPPPRAYAAAQRRDASSSRTHLITHLDVR